MHEQSISHVMLMILVKMNNRHIMHFSVYAVVARRTFISVALCVHLPQNVNDPDSASTFLPTVPKLVSQKKKGKMFLFVCMRVIRARGPLFAFSRAIAVIAHRLASTELPAPAHFPAAVAPEAGYNQLQGPYWGPHCLRQHTFFS